MKAIEQVRKIVSEHTATEVQGVLVDAWTAGMLVKVYDGLNEDNRAKFDGLMERDIRAAVDLGWKCVG